MSEKSAIEIGSTRTITLRSPQKVGDQTYDSLVLREPTTFQMEGANKLGGGNGISVVIELLSVVSNVPAAVIRKIDSTTFKQAQADVIAFSKLVAPAEVTETDCTIELASPIADGDKPPIGSIHLREPTAGEIELSTKVFGEGMGQSIALIAAVSGVPAKVIRKLPASEYNAAVEYLGPFLGASPATGES
jgi:hypothetical protein